MKILVDTNIVARYAQPSHIQHEIAVRSVAALRSQRHHLHIVPQVLYEYWVVATRPESENGLGMSIAEADADLQRFKTLFTLVPESPSVFPMWERLVVANSVHGKLGHDARLVASMMTNGIDQILTFNERDFRRFKEITVLTPNEVVAASTPNT